MAREVPLGGTVAARRFAFALAGSLLLAAAAHAVPPDLSPDRPPDEPAQLTAFTATIDALAARERPDGGWTFDAPAGERPEMPVEGSRLSPWFPWVALHTTLDDDVTPGAIRFLLALGERTGDARYRRAAERGVDLLVRAQLDSGAWPHAWRPPWLRALHVSREDHPSLNDGLTPVIGGDYGIPALLRRLALGASESPLAPLPGDPGVCTGASDPMLAGHGARSLIAEAGMELATIEPPPISPCAGAPRELVAAGGLR